ncbi:MAG: hypothetical protein MHM6MM_000226 [Cercozoa sp. M6MM]
MGYGDTVSGRLRLKGGLPNNLRAQKKKKRKLEKQRRKEAKETLAKQALDAKKALDSSKREQEDEASAALSSRFHQSGKRHEVDKEQLEKEMEKRRQLEEETRAARAAAELAAIEANIDVDEHAGLTATEKQLLRVQARNRQRQMKKHGSQAPTYEQRIEGYKTMLANLSDHHDMPKIASAGLG